MRHRPGADLQGLIYEEEAEDMNWIIKLIGGPKVVFYKLFDWALDQLIKLLKKKPGGLTFAGLLIFILGELLTRCAGGSFEVCQYVNEFAPKIIEALNTLNPEFIQDTGLFVAIGGFIDRLRKRSEVNPE